MSRQQTTAAASGHHPHAFLTRGVVSLAVHALPSGPVRERYHQELIADLYGKPWQRQYAEAWGVTTHMWALRAAVADVEPFMQKETAMHRTLLCRTNMHHTWRTYSTEDGQRYQRCSRCGKDHTDRYNGGGRVGFGAFA
jgi:hypothetical protein